MRMDQLTRHVNGVLFDLDNTLVASELGFAAWAEWFVRERLGLSSDAAIAGEIALITRRDPDGYAPREARLRALRERHAVLTEPIEELMATFRRQVIDHFPPIDADTMRLLAALDASEIPWGIVSNGAPTQLDKIRKLELHDRASCAVVSDVFGARKPGFLGSFWKPRNRSASRRARFSLWATSHWPIWSGRPMSGCRQPGSVWGGRGRWISWTTHLTSLSIRSPT